MTAIEVEATAAAPAGRWSAWSDRLNPILVREVQQAVKGRLFVLSVMIVLLVSVVIAIAAVGDRGSTAAAGRNVFDAGLATLVPLLLFVVPMQAYQSMRLELRAGIVEQLLLSRLRPRAIVAGKLLAAMVQFLLYVSILAPLLATSYLLRGVDLPTIAVSLVFALVFCVAATAAAISAAAQGASPAMRSFAQVAAAFGFGMLTFGMMGVVGSGEYARELGRLLRAPQFPAVVSVIVLGCGAGTMLSALTAQSFLLHAFENRSSGFRAYLFALPLVGLGWMLLFVDATRWRYVLPSLTVFSVLLGVAFGVFMVTEQKQLSPRVRAHVPRRAGLALLAAPFLPGRDRGLLCLLLYLALLAGSGMVWSLAMRVTVASGMGSYGFEEAALRTCGFIAAYGVIYLSIARWLRGKLPATVVGNHAARFLLPIVVVAFLLLPMLVDVFARGGVDGWHPGHLMNPFWTIAEFARQGGNRALPLLLLLAAACVLLQLRGLFTGVREVLAASAQRRALPPVAPEAAADA